MTQNPFNQDRMESNAEQDRKPSALTVWFQPKIVALAVLGFASGVPFRLTTETLQAWMRVVGVDLTTIGIFSLVALPYSLKFLWAPVMDRFVPPYLGRRRGWLLTTQILLIAAIAAMAATDPRSGLQLMAVAAVVIAFLSASQDIVGDAYRTDVLKEREMGAGTAVWITGYRVALIATGGGALMLANHMPWPAVYLSMAALMLLGVFATLRAPEPPATRPPDTFADAVILPFGEFFKRRSPLWALLVLAFIVVYRLPDSFATIMATPFLLDAGYSLTEIGAIRSGLGVVATIAGAIAGGALVARTGLNKGLWIFAALQALSNLGYYVLAVSDRSQILLVVVMVIENFCGGLVAAGFVGFLMSLCSRRFSATQYALLSSLMGVSRDVFVAPSGAIAEATGWTGYFLLTIVIALPGVALLPVMAPWGAASPVFSARRGEENAGE